MKYQRLLIICIWALINAPLLLKAQTDPQFSLFRFNQLFINPATAGADGMTRFQLLGRMQWTGYQTSSGMGGAPTTYVFSGSIPLNFLKSAVGVHYANDKLGAYGSQEVQLSYAYKLNIGENTLALGARAGFLSNFIDFDILNPRESGDPLIQTGRVSTSSPDLALGAYYDATTFYVGASINHLNKPTMVLGSESTLKPHIYLNAGYRWEPLYGLEIEPMALVKTTTDFSVRAMSVDLGLMATWNQRFFGGVTYRWGESVGGILGANLLDNKIRIAAAADLVSNSTGQKAPASYELLLSYALPAFVKGKKTIVRTPRFRY